MFWPCSPRGRACRSCGCAVTVERVVILLLVVAVVWALFRIRAARLRVEALDAQQQYRAQRRAFQRIEQKAKR